MNRFDLEQQILDCWHVVDDLKILTESVCDNSPPLTEDEITNILIGMEHLYQLKFQRLFRVFEAVTVSPPPEDISYKTTIHVLNEEIYNLMTKVTDHGSGHIKTAISVLQQRVKELQNGTQ